MLTIDITRLKLQLCWYETLIVLVKGIVKKSFSFFNHCRKCHLKKHSGDGGRAGRAFVEANYDIDKLKDRLVNTYEGMLERKEQ